MENPSVGTARREFLKFLAASPYVAALGGVTAFLEQSGLAQDPRETSEVIASPAQALNVFDFEEAAHRKAGPARTRGLRRRLLGARSEGRFGVVQRLVLSKAGLADRDQAHDSGRSRIALAAGGLDGTGGPHP